MDKVIAVNGTNYLKNLDDELTQADSTLYWLLISIIASIIWVVYLTYYNSRLIGVLLTYILNRVLKYGYIHIGSFSLSVLSGKIMFRNLHIVTEDYSLRLQLGYAIFRWWRPLTDKSIQDDLSHSETRLSIYLDSYEFHVYNRSHVYSRLERLFGLQNLIEPQTKNYTSTAGPTNSPLNKQIDLMKQKWRWRDLIPVIKIEISSGRIIFGNDQLPYSLLIRVHDANIVYTTKPASTPFDLFMHVVKFRADNVKIMAVRSPKYKGKIDEPPRCMGEGFAFLQSNDVDIYYYCDEAGITPYEPEQVYLANGDIISIRTFPCWGIDVKCGKNTDVSYGPWADRQRENLWKFFFPADYLVTEATVLPEPGQLRKFKNFDFKMSMQNGLTIDILFTKNKETQAIHTHCSAGSYLEFTLPMFTEETGYTTKVTGQLMHLDASTSVQFRSFIECETLEFDVEIKYPPCWNSHQDWNINLTTCRATGYLIYNHKQFFTDLIDDWSSKTLPDIYHFVPYTITTNILLKEFELITLTNEWNWIDCFGTNSENAHISVCGDMFDFSFIIPFIDFLPNTVPINFFIRGESAEAMLYLPECNTSRHILIALAESVKISDRNGNAVCQNLKEKRWHKVCLKSAGWIEVVTTPIAALSFTYIYHPSPLLIHQCENLDDEDMLLIPMVPLVYVYPTKPKRIAKKTNSEQSGTVINNEMIKDDFDAGLMEPDLINVEIEIGPTEFFAYGTIVLLFLRLKENYFGDDQKFTDFEKNISLDASKVESVGERVLETPFDARKYRPFSLKVHLTLHDVHLHLVKNCSPDSPPCPAVFLERLVFEMDKRYHETMLQVLISPALLVAQDHVARAPGDEQIKDGHLSLSGLQVRGHAMFSHMNLHLDSETLEYAWLVEVILGDLTGRLTAIQLQNIIEFLQTFIFLVEDKENTLMNPAVMAPLR